MNLGDPIGQDPSESEIEQTLDKLSMAYVAGQIDDIDFKLLLDSAESAATQVAVRQIGAMVDPANLGSPAFLTPDEVVAIAVAATNSEFKFGWSDGAGYAQSLIKFLRSRDRQAQLAERHPDIYAQVTDPARYDFTRRVGRALWNAPNQADVAETVAAITPRDQWSRGSDDAIARVDATRTARTSRLRRSPIAATKHLEDVISASEGLSNGTRVALVGLEAAFVGWTPDANLLGNLGGGFGPAVRAEDLAERGGPRSSTMEHWQSAWSSLTTKRLGAPSVASGPPRIGVTTPERGGRG